MGRILIVIVATAVAVLFQNADALSDDSMMKLQARFMPDIQACQTEMNVDMMAIKEQLDAGTMDADNPDRCFFACIFKKQGFIDEEGKFDKQKSEAGAQEHVTDAKDIEFVHKSTEACGSVNEEPVSDGTEGCDRALLMVNCLKDVIGLFSGVES